MTEKAVPKRQNVILPRAEYEALMDDVRKLITADEQLLNAYAQLLDSYEELARRSARGDLRGFEGRPARRGFWSVFRRRRTSETPVYVERVPMESARGMGGVTSAVCLNCGADLDPSDKFCRVCARAR